MVMALENNTYLAKLNMTGNPTSYEHMQLIIQALQFNNTLEKLFLTQPFHIQIIQTFKRSLFPFADNRVVIV